MIIFGKTTTTDDHYVVYLFGQRISVHFHLNVVVTDRRRSPVHGISSIALRFHRQLFRLTFGRRGRQTEFFERIVLVVLEHDKTQLHGVIIIIIIIVMIILYLFFFCVRKTRGCLIPNWTQR